MVAVEVNLLRVELRTQKGLGLAEGSIVELQAEVGTLRKQLAPRLADWKHSSRMLKDAPGEIILDCWASQNARRGLWSRPSWKTGSGMCCSLWVSLEYFLVERVHRALVAPPRPGALPRVIIARLLNYRDRDCVLRAARDSDNVVFENWKISIYTDYTNKVKELAKEFFGGEGEAPRNEYQIYAFVSGAFEGTLWRPTGAGGVVTRVSGADGSDWQNRERERTTDPMDQGAVDVSATRVEIQQDGTMAVAPDESMAGTSAGLAWESSLTSMQS
ncbi:hypothetical protein NDU88_003718 [Pleurodeles waltl]|uniref:Uncharacterized protein n=1 Tax=Pleurodeles waltl TaxID=8319 RepID=A0AAV7V1E5_PLEWA|nr:hypothetical protein NDU88_003718 [Pleurodeles waltl]